MKRSPPPWKARAAGLLLAGLVALVFVTLAGPGLMGNLLAQLSPDRVALRQALQDPLLADMRTAYAGRYYEPIWLERGRPRAETERVIASFQHSAADGLRPESYNAAGWTPRLRLLANVLASERARSELALSDTFARYVYDLHAPVPAADMVYTDAALSPWRPSRRTTIEAVAEARPLAKGVERVTRVNPIYAQYRAALQKLRTGSARDPEAENRLLINLDRVRALPVDLGPKFVLVDAAAGRLSMYENGRVVDSMKVVVGTAEHQTPAMTGMIRYAVFNPNWNVPPDLTRDTYAPKIRASRAVLNDLQMDVWSDYSPQARKIDANTVDWAGVARGERAVWLRQRPGPRNAMGAVKFMLPNELGIYLHDTPNRELFELTQRTTSAGCIRVEDYKRLARWLYGRDGVGPQSEAPEQRIDLPAPVPVYITYLTVEPVSAAARPDVYGRDPKVLQELRSLEAITPVQKTSTTSQPPAPPAGPDHGRPAPMLRR